MTDPRWSRSIHYGPAVVPLMAVATGVQVGSSIMGGISQNKAAKEEAAYQQEQGDIAYKEAQMNAENEAFNQKQTIGRQRLAFLANGVSLEGSPSTVLSESEKYGQQKVQSILDQGTAQYNLAQRQAAITKNKGRAALVSGITGAIGSAASGVGNLSKAGAFDPAPKKATS